ncbi:MAG: 1-acyl-sn-glycerol-3-phosphate acyltransferase [Treponema sp.]|jgi:glycerol-3-phosphate O-acyltransferase|nr:1-acyl-sn-glycerol-3-phosphate acyltransferase [Treponema sp.]
MDTLATAFGRQIKEALSLSKVPSVVTGHNVYQEGDNNILPILDEMAASLILPGSRLDGLENLEELLVKAETGKSCLLLPEHYSNFDLTIFSLMARRAGGRGADISNALVTIAGMKLNEDSPGVAAFAGAYTRIVIYPSRSLQDMDSEKNREEIIRSNAINRAAMKALTKVKTEGHLVLVFPAGTRYRPWDPASKRGVREIDSYIRTFDYMCCVALNGQILHVNKTDMMNDVVTKDLLLVTAGPVQACADFRDKARAAAEAAGIKDIKQAAVDAVMADLDKLHLAAEEKRQKLLQG